MPIVRRAPWIDAADRVADALDADNEAFMAAVGQDGNPGARTFHKPMATRRAPGSEIDPRHADEIGVRRVHDERGIEPIEFDADADDRGAAEIPYMGIERIGSASVDGSARIGGDLRRG